MSKRTRTSVSKACDRLWANFVRVRARGRCERCTEVGRLEAHHAYSRRDYRLRWAPQNGCALCHACHRWAEGYPLEFSEWFLEHRSGDATWLAVERTKGPIVRTLGDYLELEAELRSMIDGEFPYEEAMRR